MYVRAQVTIGSDLVPNGGALLDMKEFASNNLITSTRGLNFPRVSLQAANRLEPCATTNITNSASHRGLVVYHTNNAVMDQGMYYWNGASWRRLVDEIPPEPVTTINLQNLKESFTSLPAGGSTTHLGGNLPIGDLDAVSNKYYLTIPEDGSYAFAFRIFGITDIDETNYPYPRAQTYYVNVMKDDVILDVAELSAVVVRRAAGDRTTVQGFTTVLGVAGLVAGDRVEFRFSHFTVCSPLKLSASENVTIAARTSMIFWKL